MQQASIKIFLLLLSLISTSVLALSSDREQPIKILADSLEIDESKHINIYQGNVDMRQGSMHITADRIVFHFTEKNDIEWLEITGAPAVFKQLNNNNDPVSGQALKINIYQDKSLIELLEDAEFKSQLDTIQSNQITVNTKSDALQAGGNKQNERVEMLIHPKK